MQNKIRLKDVKRRVNKVQTHGDTPNHISSGYSKELNVQNVRYFMNFQVVQRRDTTPVLSKTNFVFKPDVRTRRAKY